MTGGYRRFMDRAVEEQLAAQTRTDNAAIAAELWSQAWQRWRNDPLVAARARTVAQVLAQLRRDPKAGRRNPDELDRDELIAALTLVIAEQLNPGPAALAEAWQRGVTAGAGYTAFGRTLPANPYRTDLEQEDTP